MPSLPSPIDPPPADTENMGKVMAILAWVLTILLLALFFGHWSKKQNLPRAQYINIDGDKKTIIQANVHNQYLVAGNINDKAVVFILDTGASEVVIPGSLAKTLGLKKGPSAMAKTAGGNVTVYMTRIPELIVGNIRLVNVSASINPQMTGDEILLGMSALNKIKMVQESDQIILSIPQASAE